MNKIANTMTGVILTGHGDFDKLEYHQDLPVPQPKSHEVLVKVAAAGLNNTDINTRLAWYSKTDENAEDASWNGGSLTFPRIQGADVCGEIVAVGDTVSDERIGERVLINPCLWTINGQRLERPWYFGSETDGGFAEYTVADSRQVFAVNSNYSDTELASFPCSYSTAENMLVRTNVGENDTVLVTGASGGVGSAVVQLAKARGATIIGVCAAEKAEAVKAIGASQTVNRGNHLIEILGKDSVTVVVDLVGGSQWSELLDVLKPFGRYAVAGAIGGAFVELDIRTLYLKDLRFFGCTSLEPETFPNLIKRIEANEVKPLVAQTYPLSEIVRAQQAFLDKQYTGNIVLTIAETGKGKVKKHPKFIKQELREINE